ncbi:FecR family protein [Pseudopedobacter beijingensis]|uniref:FecR family protein n=1 Tax=Pseudopedobacter beijingensis TaxID=1207056 RepID=A0ABW4I7S3_9SPHI
MEKNRLLYLIERSQKGTATPAEILELEDFYERFENKPGYLVKLDDTQKKAYKELIFSRIQAKTHKQPLKLYKNRLLKGLRMAASVFIVCGIAYYTYQLNKNISTNEKTLIVKQDSSARNKAILTLANGQKIVLTDAKIGVLSDEAGVAISKTSEGEIVYTYKNSADQQYAVNKIETPRGEKYQIRLPDGTKVWLNAASSLRYPSAFTGKERKVKLSGEAYFEVAVNKTKPFKVETTNQTIEVLGTHFNINSYSDESWTKTTLLEGSVKVSRNERSVTLKPGQQAFTDANTVDIQTSVVDTEEILAWKNGYFLFENADIRYIMKNLSRWYNIEVQYEGDITKQKFGGAFQQSASLEELLKYLESYGDVHFKVQGRRVTVMK